MSAKALGTDLTQGSATRKLLAFSWPFMLSNLLQILYNLVDMMVVGRFVGSVGLSAVANGGDVLNLATMLAMGFTSAGQVLISQRVGMGDKAGVQRLIGTMFSFIMLLAVGLTTLGLLGLKNLLNLLRVPEPALAQAWQYSLVCLCGLVFIFGYNLVSAILRGMGESKRPFLFIAIAAVSNFLLDLLFVAGFGMGARGAALATVAGQAISFVCSLVYLYRYRQMFGFDFKPSSFAFDRPALAALVKLGLPMALQHSAITISKLFVNSYINSFGLVASAVSGVGNKLGQCAMVITNALSAASTSMVGQCLGAGKMGRIRRVVGVSTGIGLVSTALLSVCMMLWPQAIFGLFTGDENVLALASTYAVIAVLNFNAFALRGPMLALINGVGNARLAFVIGILDGIVGRIFLAMFLGLSLQMGVMGFWLGDVFASYIPFLLGGVYFLSGRWKRKKPVAA